MPLNFAIEQSQFLMQGGVTIRRQCLDEVFDHRPQAAHDLHVA